MINEKTLNKIKMFGKRISYLQFGGLFTNGKLLIDIEQDLLKIVFSHKGGDIIKLLYITQLSFNDIRSYIQNIVIDIYFEYEWDGMPIKLDRLGKILCLNDSGVKMYLNRIIYKAEKLSSFLK